MPPENVQVFLFRRSKKVTEGVSSGILFGVILGIHAEDNFRKYFRPRILPKKL